MKARELITDALVEIGANGALEIPSNKQLQVSLRALNRILDGWQADRLMVYAVSEVVATVDGISATIGPGMQFDCPTPQSLHRGCYYLRSDMSYDLPVWDRESYNGLTLKNQANDFPEGVFYDRLGTVFFTKSISPTEVHLQVLARLSKFENLETDYVFPDGYQSAIYETLCERLPPLFSLPVAVDKPRIAANARRVIRRANADVPVLQIECGGARFNILTNQ